MNLKPKYRQLVAFLLAVMVAQTIALKELHQLFDHHEQLAHCGDTKPGEPHLHTEEYAPIDCSICFFSFAPATLDFQEFALAIAAGTPLRNDFTYVQTLPVRVNWHFQHRGPPALAA